MNMAVRERNVGFLLPCDITFSCHAHAMLSSESDEVDERDVKRVRVRPSYVKKFLVQKLGDEDAAYEMMVRHNFIYLLFISFNLS